MKALFCLGAALVCAAPALASVSVTSPLTGASVTSPFTLAATASPCSSQGIASMGYSLDSSSTTTVVKGSIISAIVSATVGSHTLHVKSWGTNGAACSTSVPFTVVKGSSTTNVTVTAPLNGATVKSPFSLLASGTLCSSGTITKMGYSLDSSTTNTTFSGPTINTSVSAAAGSHTLHVKSWTSNGLYCATSVSVTVAVPPSAPSIPSNAVATKLIQNLATWTGEHDAGTSGTSTGAMSLVASPSLSGSARKFATSYTDYGGERYHVSLTPDAASTNFVYDAKIYFASASDIANIEMDLNQVDANGNTIIYGFQCDGWSRTWDYTKNSGTIASPKSTWLHSTQACNPQKWAANTWHHVQIQYSRDSSGNVTYKAVWLDGAEQDLNITVLSAFALGWGPALDSNFQIDGFTSTSGSSTVYLDSFTLYSW